MEHFDIRAASLRSINSLCKYPSIPTYHALDPKTGKLTEAVAVDFGGAPVIVTEKIDGTNARVILLPDGSFDGGSGWLIGSREELLTAAGDLVANPAQQIVAALDEAMEDVTSPVEGALVVLYLEVFGGKTSAASANYTGTGRLDARLFDVATYEDWASLLERPLSEIASWRDRVGPTWWTVDAVEGAAWYPFETVPRLTGIWPPRLRTDTPFLELMRQGRLPLTLAETREWLDMLFGSDRTTRCALDEQARGGAEGVVVRTADRHKIAKLKWRDYDRALRG